MPNRSQRHLREVFGVDSAGDIADTTSSPSAPGSTVIAEGDQITAAVFTTPSSLADGDRLTVSITADAEPPDAFLVDAIGADITGAALAVLIAAEIDADPQYSASSTGRRVSVLAVDPVEAVTINSVTVAATP
jgi:hypothetical protein